MIKYNFNINEEIARWVTEVYVRSHQELGWWIAFTNPIAGPWKKINALNGEGVPVEIYRFEREGERPDLILVNDAEKTILIVEAKDFVEKLIAKDQMTKSIRVIEEITLILRSCSNEHWISRREYKIIPSFLWYTDKEENIHDEDELVKKTFKVLASAENVDLFNIVVTKNNIGNLENNFVYKTNINKIPKF